MVLDRAGVTGPDGASHNGMWDLSMLGIVPGMRVAAPRDATRLREELGEALDVDDGPTALRFPKGDVGEDIPAVERRDGVDVLAVPAGGLTDDVLLVARRRRSRRWRWRWPSGCSNQGIGVTVIDPRWVLPVPEAIGELADAAQAASSRWRTTGSTAASARRCRPRCGAPRSTCRAATSGCRRSSSTHASRGEVLADVGLTDQDVARRITGWVAALGSGVAEAEISEHLD